MTPPAVVGVLSRLRGSGTSGAWFFALLICLVAGERRLAEFQFNLRSVDVGIESDDVLDGDEIRTRLIVLNDDRLPTIPDVSRAETSTAAHARAQRLVFLAPGRPAPRGPPAVVSM